MNTWEESTPRVRLFAHSSSVFAKRRRFVGHLANDGEAMSEGKKEAVKTYIEQTKLLVTLASAFLFAPAGLVGILKDKSAAGLSQSQVCTFIFVEVFFI